MQQCIQLVHSLCVSLKFLIHFYMGIPGLIFFSSVKGALSADVALDSTLPLSLFPPSFFNNNLKAQTLDLGGDLEDFFLSCQIPGLESSLLLLTCPFGWYFSQPHFLFSHLQSSQNRNMLNITIKGQPHQWRTMYTHPFLHRIPIHVLSTTSLSISNPCSSSSLPMTRIFSQYSS